MAAVKPTARPLWTKNNLTPLAARQEPVLSKKTEGWSIDERPPMEYMNWLFYNLGVEWLEYFEAITDQVAGLTAIYDAYVGSSGIATHATLAAAVAAVGNGGRILVLESQALAATVQVTANNVEIMLKPGVTISKNGAATGLQLTGSGIRVKGGRFASFSAGGDKAIQVDAGANYCMISEVRFANNTTDIDDQNGTTATALLINE